METLCGADFAHALTAGFRCLERYRDTINALNVYPVPDGDTGTNMLLTMRAGIPQDAPAPDAAVGDVAARLADGAFWEARGNSGVILSQFFKGIAQGLAGLEVCAPSDLTAAFQSATDAAYRAVGNPVEGTMLTVIRCAAESLKTGMESGAAADITAHWKTALDAAQIALDDTPNLLPRLKEAGVVDAGGMGIVAILGGAYAYLTGQDIEQLDLGFPTTAGDSAQLTTAAVESDFLDASTEAQWGYCTQFLIQGESLDLEQVRADLAQTADSLVIVGDERVIRVHIHIADPGAALTYGVALGELSQIKIDNMNLQNQDWAAGHQAARPESGGPAAVRPGLCCRSSRGWTSATVPRLRLRRCSQRRANDEPQRGPTGQRRRPLPAAAKSSCSPTTKMSPSPQTRRRNGKMTLSGFMLSLPAPWPKALPPLWLSTPNSRPPPTCKRCKTLLPPSFPSKLPVPSALLPLTA